MFEMYGVRFAVIDDLKQLVQASTEVLENLKKQGKSDWYRGNDAEEFLEVLTSGNDDRCIIAETKGKVIGYFIINNHNEKMCHKRFPEYLVGEGFCVDGMGVIPEYRRQGVLIDMLEFAENYAEAEGKKYFYGEVFPENYPAICSFARYTSEFKISDETEKYLMRRGRILIRKYFLAKI